MNTSTARGILPHTHTPLKNITHHYLLTFNLKLLLISAMYLPAFKIEPENELEASIKNLMVSAPSSNTLNVFFFSVFTAIDETAIFTICSVQ